MEKVSAKSHFGDAKLPFGTAEMLLVDEKLSFVSD